MEYPTLYNIICYKNVTVANAMALVPSDICFRRTLACNIWDRWLHLVQRLMLVQLSHNDVFLNGV
jgi:hypothetical protein